MLLCSLVKQPDQPARDPERMRFSFVLNLKIRAALTVSVLIILSTFLSTAVLLLLVRQHLASLTSAQFSSIAQTALAGALVFAIVCTALIWRTIHPLLDEQRMVQQRHQSMEQRLGLIANNIPALLAYIDASGNVIFASSLLRLWR